MQTITVVRNSYKIRASNLSYLFDKCPRCFYLSMSEGIDQPFSGGHAAISDIERDQTDMLKKAKSLSSLNENFPKGHIVVSKTGSTGSRVETDPFEVNGVEVVLSGSYDYVVELADGSGYAIVTFKTSDPRDMAQTTRQMNCLAYALENDIHEDKRKHITQLGVIVFDPVAFDSGKDFYRWFEAPLDQKNFLKEIEQIVKTASAGEPDYTRDNPKNPEKITCGHCERDQKILARYTKGPK